MQSDENVAVVDDEEEKRKMLSIFRDESGRNDEWNKKYIHSSLFLLGAGAFGSVFQVTTRLYTQSKQKIAKDRYIYHPEFLATMASQRRLKIDQQDKLKDRMRDERLLDIVAIKYEILEQSHLEDGATRFFLFLRREFLIMDMIWRKFPRLLIGFPMVFDYGYIGDKLQYGVNPKYKNIFTYLNIHGEEVKFFADTSNRNLEGVTKISFMSMELLGPSIDDFRAYFEPWYADNRLKTFFQVRTVFRIADQFLCRLYVMHRAGFVHHDLKPDNIAVGNGRAMNTVYLLDFGFAKQVSNSAASEWMGSRKFISVDTYAGERPNYSQDIESWFYIVLTLLYDALPWSEEFIAPLLSENCEESAKWNMVINMKKTWWAESSEAKTLHAMLDNIARLHAYEVPDIRAIMDQLHKKTRDLRNSLRQMSDPQTMNAELANMQSNISKGYMSIRKVLLQIFDIPTIWTNQHLGDSEMRSYLDARAEKKLPLYAWDRSNFRWEWDRNHERMLFTKSLVESTENIEGSQSIALAFSKVSEHLGTRRESRGKLAEHARPSDVSDPNDQPLESPNNEENLANKQLQWLLSALHNSVNPRLRASAHQAFGAFGRSPGGIHAARRYRPDEISFVYDRQTDSLVPKNSGRRHIDTERASLRQLSFGSTGVFSVGTSRKEPSNGPVAPLRSRHNSGAVRNKMLDSVWRTAIPRVLTPSPSSRGGGGGSGGSGSKVRVCRGSCLPSLASGRGTAGGSGSSHS